MSNKWVYLKEPHGVTTASRSLYTGGAMLHAPASRWSGCYKLTSKQTNPRAVQTTLATSLATAGEQTTTSWHGKLRPGHHSQFARQGSKGCISSVNWSQETLQECRGSAAVISDSAIKALQFNSGEHASFRRNLHVSKRALQTGGQPPLSCSVRTLRPRRTGRAALPAAGTGASRRYFSAACSPGGGIALGGCVGGLWSRCRKCLSTGSVIRRGDVKARLVFGPVPKSRGI